MKNLRDVTQQTAVELEHAHGHVHLVTPDEMSTVLEGKGHRGRQQPIKQQLEKTMQRDWLVKSNTES